MGFVILVILIILSPLVFVGVFAISYHNLKPMGRMKKGEEEKFYNIRQRNNEEE